MFLRYRYTDTVALQTRVTCDKHSCVFILAETQTVSSTSARKPEEKNTTQQNPQGSLPATKNTDFYSEDYFSSGSDDENQVGGIASKSQTRRKMQSNDDLFYDPHMDAEDESWVIQQRISHRNRGKSSMLTN